MSPGPCEDMLTAWKAVSPAVMRSRQIGPARLVPGGTSSAGQNWHGLARCGGWLRFARDENGGDSPAQAARQRPRAPPRGAASPKGGPIPAPASLLCFPVWQWAEMAEALAAGVAEATVMVATGAAAGVVEMVGAARGRAAGAGPRRQ